MIKINFIPAHRPLISYELHSFGSSDHESRAHVHQVTTDQLTALLSSIISDRPLF